MIVIAEINILRKYEDRQLIDDKIQLSDVFRLLSALFYQAFLE